MGGWPRRCEDAQSVHRKMKGVWMAGTTACLRQGACECLVFWATLMPSVLFFVFNLEWMRQSRVAVRGDIHLAPRDGLAFTCWYSLRERMESTVWRLLRDRQTGPTEKWDGLMGRQEDNDSEWEQNETRLSSLSDKGRENAPERVVVGGEETHSNVFFLAVLLHLCVCA